MCLDLLDTAVLMLQEARNLPDWMQDVVGQESDGLLMMPSSSPSRASTNASADSQDSMEHAQKITPEIKSGGRPKSANEEVCLYLSTCTTLVM